MPNKPKTIDDYLATVAPDRRAALEMLRRTIVKLRPDVVECISYSMPAFRLGKHVVAGFLATGSGCSYYPFSGTTLSTLADALATYSRTKSALHFDPERPLPKTLVKKLLDARIAETEGSRSNRARTPAAKTAVRAAKKRASPARARGTRSG